ncbi:MULTISPECIES: hypothetical protein [unclassified Sphingomonas]|uniref:hypothetical protein n=1 Tax=unclassified Sphingomonas TaxID=196159 RepID=UPI0022B2FF93|nr:hypothetical protein [Sphingomonas sp. NIBR02145]WHU00853.1 hypothetical protein O3305_11525 [Sphingomonas sp. NIBR02145]
MRRPSPVPVLRQLGIVSGFAVAGLSLAYLLVLAIGLATLPERDAPIGQPWFGAMEILILLLVPFLLGLATAVRGTGLAPRFTRPALPLMAAALALTSVVHLSILALGAEDAFAWPSLPYMLDILAWDGFFAVAVLLMAPAFRGEVTIYRLLLGSGALALLGLLGPLSGVMPLRMIGVIGYALVFPIAAALIARWFSRWRPAAQS